MVFVKPQLLNMSEKNILESLINAPSGDINNSLEKLAMYLSSNKVYKYTTTYLTDADKEFKTFKTNIADLKSDLLGIFSMFTESLQKIPLELLSYDYELQINSALYINSEEPDKLNVIEINEDKLLYLLTQSTLQYFFLTWRFSYEITIPLMPWVKINSIEHTFEINKENDPQATIDYFINIINLDLCTKASYINK